VFAAGLVHALLAGQPMERALETAAAWGATAVACQGLPARDAIARLA
jgi:sugar/nucleoside kinase (ribokinase family)